MANSEMTKVLVENYLKFFARHEKDGAALKPLLSEKLHFKSPLGEFFTSDTFISDLKRNALSIRELNVRQVIADGSKACALYDVVSNDPEIGTLMFSEWFEVSEGKISKVTSTYDASDVRKSMSQI
ncbi:MAG: hypothetical protein V4736_15970 [Bdellovibrionota bacterium]